MTAIFAVMGLMIAMAVPAGAQEFGVLAIDPHEGPVGSVVEGLVDPGVVEESCMTLEAVQAQFGLPHNLNPGPFAEEFYTYGPLIGMGDDLMSWLIAGPGDQEQLAALAFGINVFGGIGQHADLAGGLFQELFILTFADIATQEPTGEIGNFDPNTGVGQVDVPDVAPGLWVVAATCVFPTLTDESFLAAIAAGTAVLTDECGPFPESNNCPGGNLDAALEMMATAMFTELMTPQEGAGPWVDIYCVWDTDGDCHPDLRELTLEELEALEEDGLLGDLGGELPATPVGASPRFTG